jgi:hypothetical protein
MIQAAWMIKIDNKYVRYILPGIILQGDERDLMHKMRDPAFVRKIGVPESCLSCKYGLVPLHVAEGYFKQLGLEKQEPEPTL